jgi:hypothetical protein
MMTSMKAFVALAMIAVMCAAATPASAISVELAKKCRALMLKAYPYELPGTRKGNSEAQREYFNKCVANDGNMPAEPKAAEPKAADPKSAGPTGAGPSGSGKPAPAPAPPPSND